MTARPSAGASRRERTFDVTTPGDGYGQQGQQGWQQSYGDQGTAGGNPPGWGEPATPAQPRNGMGTAALVFGILALLSIVIVWVPFLGIVTIILAILADHPRLRSGGAASSRCRPRTAASATTGLVLGVIMLIIGVITQILVIFFAVAFLNFGGANSLQQLQDCVNNANNQPNPAAVQQAYEQCVQAVRPAAPRAAAAGGRGRLIPPARDDDGPRTVMVRGPSCAGCPDRAMSRLAARGTPGLQPNDRPWRPY